MTGSGRRRQPPLLKLPRDLHGGHPEDRGSLDHAVEIAISEAGAVSGHVIQAFDRAGARVRRFGAD